MHDSEKSESQVRGEAQVAFAQDALRGIVILNGGAILALLTFFGQAWSKNEAQATFVIMALRPGLVLFVLGVLCGIAAQGFAYLAQQYFVEGRRIPGVNFRRVCIALSIGGMYFFAHGCYATIAGMLTR
jgi:hypothetical protein